MTSGEATERILLVWNTVGAKEAAGIPRKEGRKGQWNLLMDWMWGVRERGGPETPWDSHVSNWKDGVVFAEIRKIVGKVGLGSPSGFQFRAY